jgi:hypothetical protein
VSCLWISIRYVAETFYHKCNSLRIGPSPLYTLYKLDNMQLYSPFILLSCLICVCLNDMRTCQLQTHVACIASDVNFWNLIKWLFKRKEQLTDTTNLYRPFNQKRTIFNTLTLNSAQPNLLVMASHLIYLLSTTANNNMNCLGIKSVLFFLQG